MALTPLSEALERILATVEDKPDWKWSLSRLRRVVTALKPLTPPLGATRR